MYDEDDDPESDDELLDETDPELVAYLGFDPRELDEEEQSSELPEPPTFTIQ